MSGQNVQPALSLMINPWCFGGPWTGKRRCERWLYYASLAQDKGYKLFDFSDKPRVTLTLGPSVSFFG
jgi:hypothetical protein